MNTEFDTFLNKISSRFGDCEDFIIRRSGQEKSRFALVFIRGITDRNHISEAIIRPILNFDISTFNGDFSGLLETPAMSAADDENQVADFIAKGLVLIMIESPKGFFKTLANAQYTEGRSVQEPGSDVTIKGPKAGFVEDAEKNSAMIRKYIRTPDLRFKQFTVGSVSQTKVILTYISGRASEKLVEDISNKISNLNATAITDSGNLAMLLGGRKTHILPDCGSSEKVDKVAYKLMAGRIGIIVDGSPFVLTMPYLFIEGLQSSDDYFHTPIYATFIRILRAVAFFAAIFAPAILCTIVNHNPSIIPEEFYGIISEARQDIPLSFFWEIAAILILFETLREVGVRMPRTVGDAVGIVGSILLGNTAVETGIVSSVGVLTVAFSAVCAFITPAFMYVIVISRIAVLAISEFFGIWGLVASAIALTLMLFFKKSFGVYYMTPLIPFDKNGMEDFIFCNPKKTLGRREKLGTKK